MSQFTGNLFLEQLLNTCVQMPIPGIVAGSPLKQVRTQRPEGRLVSSTRLTTSSDFSGTSARETTDPQGQTWVQIFLEILLKVSPVTVTIPGASGGLVAATGSQRPHCSTG